MHIWSAEVDIVHDFLLSDLSLIQQEVDALEELSRQLFLETVELQATKVTSVHRNTFLSLMSVVFIQSCTASLLNETIKFNITCTTLLIDTTIYLRSGHLLCLNVKIFFKFLMPFFSVFRSELNTQRRFRENTSTFLVTFFPSIAFGKSSW